MKGLLGTVALLGICGGIFAAMFFGLMGCDASPRNSVGNVVAEKRVEDGETVFKISIAGSLGHANFKYIMVDDHEYLMMNNGNQAGITHSPKCPCHKNKAEIVLPVNIVTNDMPQVVPL